VVGVEPVVLGGHRSQTGAIRLRARYTGVRSEEKKIVADTSMTNSAYVLSIDTKIDDLG